MLKIEPGFVSHSVRQQSLFSFDLKTLVTDNLLGRLIYSVFERWEVPDIILKYKVGVRSSCYSRILFRVLL